MRVLVISDVHGNLPALETVLQQPISFDAIWNLGDTTGYGPWPNECAELIRSYPQSVHLAGNHDLAATGQISTDGFNPIAAAAAKWTFRNLDGDHREWLRGLSSLEVVDQATLAHGSPRDPAFEYITTSTLAADMFAYFQTRSCFVGHTHRPLIAVDGISVTVEKPFSPHDGQVFDLSSARSLLNPGSVGQPRDGDPRAAFGVFDMVTSQFSFHRVPYPIDLVQQAILAAGLPPQLGQRLSYGM